MHSIRVSLLDPCISVFSLSYVQLFLYLHIVFCCLFATNEGGSCVYSSAIARKNLTP